MNIQFPLKIVTINGKQQQALEIARLIFQRSRLVEVSSLSLNFAAVHSNVRLD